MPRPIGDIENDIGFTETMIDDLESQAEDYRRELGNLLEEYRHELGNLLEERDATESGEEDPDYAYDRQRQEEIDDQAN